MSEQIAVGESDPDSVGHPGSGSTRATILRVDRGTTEIDHGARFQTGVASARELIGRQVAA